MSKQEIIGNGTWIDKLAWELLEREKALGRNTKLLKVESGLGASGIPHIGSLGDAVRAYGVKLALENFGYKSELVAYSDDLDGLRKIPEGFPSSLDEHLAKPVSLIPDPFGCHESYGMHMSSLLLEGLDRLDIKYDFKRAYDTYQKGLLKEQIHIILINSEKIGNKIEKLVGQEKYQKFLPYFPVYSNSNRLYTAEAYEYLPDEKKIRYKCQDALIGSKNLKGCGNDGIADITKDLGKLAWKVEFAARWQALDIRFEAYGKDIMDSVRVNDWVSDSILNYPHPLHAKYEMFLDKGGKKISKSAGNVFTPQKWLRYGTPQSLLLLLFKRISGTRQVGVDDIPTLVDEYDLYEDAFFGKKKLDNIEKSTKMKGIYEYINHLKPPSSPQEHVPYRILVQQASLFNDKDRVQKIYERLVKYRIVTQKTPSLVQKIELASNWADDYSATEEIPELSLSAIERTAVNELVRELEAFSNKEQTMELQNELQNTIYNTARRNGLDPRNFFKLMYRILIHTESGPKLANYIFDLGFERTRSLLAK